MLKTVESIFTFLSRMSSCISLLYLEVSPVIRRLTSSWLSRGVFSRLKVRSEVNTYSTDISSRAFRRSVFPVFTRRDPDRTFKKTGSNSCFLLRQFFKDSTFLQAVKIVIIKKYVWDDIMYRYVMRQQKIPKTNLSNKVLVSIHEHWGPVWRIQDLKKNVF